MGQPVGAQLGRHGVGTKPPGRLRLIDGDMVKRRNLVGTDYRVSHVGMPKAEAAAGIIRDINPDVNITFWNRMVNTKDIPRIVDIAGQTDLLCLFADSFDLMLEIADVCNRICPQIMAIFGPRCDYAEIGFSIPNSTVPLTTTFGGRKRQAITKPQALGCDTAFVANFVAAVCLRLLIADAKGGDLLACFVDAPLHIMGLRPSGVFDKQPPDVARTIYRVAVSRNMRTP